MMNNIIFGKFLTITSTFKFYDCVALHRNLVILKKEFIKLFRCQINNHYRFK